MATYRGRFDSTYEGLKRTPDGREMTGPRCFDSTYEGLKLVVILAVVDRIERFDSTYEGLKHPDFPVCPKLDNHDAGHLLELFRRRA